MAQEQSGPLGPCRRTLLRNLPLDADETFLLTPATGAHGAQDVATPTAHGGSDSDGSRPALATATAADVAPAYLSWLPEDDVRAALVIKVPVCTPGDILQCGQEGKSPIVALFRRRNTLAIALKRMVFVTTAKPGTVECSWKRLLASQASAR